MAVVEPREIGDTIQSRYSTRISTLNADMQSFTTSLKDMVENATVKPVFESVLVILSLVTVSFLLNLYLCIHSSVPET